MQVARREATSILNENGGWASVRDLRDSPHWSRLMPAPHVPFISLADLHLHISPASAPRPGLVIQPFTF